MTYHIKVFFDVLMLREALCKVICRAYIATIVVVSGCPVATHSSLVICHDRTLLPIITFMRIYWRVRIVVVCVFPVRLAAILTATIIIPISLVVILVSMTVKLLVWAGCTSVVPCRWGLSARTSSVVSKFIAAVATMTSIWTTSLSIIWRVAFRVVVLVSWFHLIPSKFEIIFIWFF